MSKVALKKYILNKEHEFIKLTFAEERSYIKEAIKKGM
jgi:hypothetical protein